MENEIKVEGELLKEIMPQKIPMLFCTKLKIENFDAKEIEGFYEVGEVDCAALDEKGNMPILALVEVMAQTVAARIASNELIAKAKITMFAPNKDDIKELFGEELLGQLKS